jgi:hypothetical protein
LALAGLLVTGLGGCVAHRIGDQNVAHAPSPKERAATIVDEPWSDLNISKIEIPLLLIQASASPYGPPHETGCAGLTREIDGLTKVLGADLQPTAIDKKGTLLSKKRAGEASWSIASGFVDGFIPFRGVIRVVSGADEHQTAVAHAVLAGFVRRAFLEGLERQQYCPSAPR